LIVFVHGKALFVLGDTLIESKKGMEACIIFRGYFMKLCEKRNSILRKISQPQLYIYRIIYGPGRRTSILPAKMPQDRQNIIASLREQLKKGSNYLVGSKGYRKYLKVDDKQKSGKESYYDGKWVDPESPTVGVQTTLMLSFSCSSLE